MVVLLLHPFRKDARSSAWIDPTLDIPLLPAGMTGTLMFSSSGHWAPEAPSHTRAAGDGGLLCWGAHLPKCLSFPIYKMVYWSVLSLTYGSFARRLIIEAAGLRKVGQTKRKTKDVPPP